MTGRFSTSRLARAVELSQAYYDYFDTRTPGPNRLHIFLTDLHYEQSFHETQKRKEKDKAPKRKTSSAATKITGDHNQVVQVYSYNDTSPISKHAKREGYYRITLHATLKARLVTPEKTRIFEKTLSSSFKDPGGYRGKRYDLGTHYPKLIDRGIQRVFEQVRGYLNPPFHITRIVAHKEDAGSYALELDGGLCDHMESGDGAVLRNGKGDYLGKGEVAANSECSRAWVVTEELRGEPSPGTLVYVEFSP